MNRDFYIDKLLLWKKSNRRKPLILEGARQVGKTWLMREFARTQYENVVYVRFDKDKLLRRIFDADFDIERIIHELEIARHVVNVTVQDLYWQLKLVEYNGRPTFYFYSKFMSDPTKDWMGERDLRCDTDEQLAYSVRKIRQGVDEYLKRQKLQYEFIVDHRQLENDVFEICYAGGSRIVCNYKPVPVSVGGVDVPSLGFILEGD